MLTDPLAHDRIISDEDKLASYACDFGQYLLASPQIAIQAKHTNDIVHGLKLSRKHQMPLTIRGAGHSSGGQSLNDGGIVLDTLFQQGISRLGDDLCVEVPAGMTWYQLERELNQLGRSIPVHTDYLSLSVGGTLSVGGIGVRSIKHGMQVDQVERLHLILPNGSYKWCSRSENSDLFQFSLASLGQIGVINKVVLNTIPYQPTSKLYLYGHRNLAALAESMAWLEDDGLCPDFFHAVRMKGQVTSVFGIEGDDSHWQPEDYNEFLLGSQEIDDYPFWSHTVQKQWLEEQNNHIRVWSDYLFDINGFYAFCRYLDDITNDRKTSVYLWSVYILAIRKAGFPHQFPLSPAYQTGSPFLYSVGIYCVVPKDDKLGQTAIWHLRDRLQERALELNGRPYLHGSYNLDRQTLASLYGNDYKKLQQLKERLDPHHLLNNNVLLAKRVNHEI